jgi:hypothetical protein
MPIEGCCRADADCDDGDDTTANACIESVCEIMTTDDDPRSEADPPAGRPDPADDVPAGRPGLCGAIGLAPLVLITIALHAARPLRQRRLPRPFRFMLGKAGAC